MKKYTIIGVIVLMSISLLGVVGLQLYWITDAVKVKQEQFDRAVNDALLSVVDKLETHEAVTVVTENMASLNQPITPDTTLIKPGQNPKPEQSTKKQPPRTAQVNSIVETTTPEQGSGSSKAGVELVFTPVQNEQVWQRESTGVSDRDSKGQMRIFFINEDTLPHVNQRIQDIPVKQGAEILHGTNVLPKGASVQIFSERYERANVTKLKEGTSFYSGKSPDSLNTFFRILKKPIPLSPDSLRVVASKLDSMHQFNRFTGKLRPVDIASIEVRNDSVFVYQKGSNKPMYVSHSSVDRTGGNRVWKYSGTRPSPTVKGSGAQVLSLTSKEPNGLSAARSVKNSTSPKRVETVKLKEKPSQGQAEQLQKASSEQKTTTEKIEQKTDKLNDVVQKMMVEYVVKDVPLKKRINPESFHSLLKNELQNKGISLPFGFWVVSSKNDTVMARNVDSYTHTSVQKYKANLFPNDIFDKSDYLDLYFPDSKTYALKSLLGMLALSAFFTFVIIATFGTTIHIIYKQKKLSEMKNDFINNMTHEFKTPIATISLATDSIANPKVYEKPEKIQYYTNIIRQENKRMNAQVENVLQIALLEKNEFKMRLEPVDLHELIVRAIDSVRLQVEERLGHIQVQLEAVRHELKSDEVHLYNVICNLLDNANKYSPNSPEISLVTRNVADGILVAVEDKGIGMSKDTQQRVFEKFYRVPTGNLHNIKGFGLGLSYVKAIVEAHRGSVSLWSEPGKGSRFEIFLPINKG